MLSLIFSIIWFLFLWLFKPANFLVFGIPIFASLFLGLLLKTGHFGFAQNLVVTIYFLLLFSVIFRLIYDKK